MLQKYVTRNYKFNRHIVTDIYNNLKKTINNGITSLFHTSNITIGFSLTDRIMHCHLLHSLSFLSLLDAEQALKKKLNINLNSAISFCFIKQKRWHNKTQLNPVEKRVLIMKE